MERRRTTRSCVYEQRSYHLIIHNKASIACCAAMTRKPAPSLRFGSAPCTATWALTSRAARSFFTSPNGLCITGSPASMTFRTGLPAAAPAQPHGAARRVGSGWKLPWRQTAWSPRAGLSRAHGWRVVVAARPARRIFDTLFKALWPIQQALMAMAAERRTTEGPDARARTPGMRSTPSSRGRSVNLPAHAGGGANAGPNLLIVHFPTTERFLGQTLASMLSIQ